MRLTRALGLAAACVVPCSATLAQDPKPTESSRPATVGFMLGASTSTLVGSDALSDLKSRAGAFGGVAVVFSVAPRVQLEVDAIYTMKGFRSGTQGSVLDLSAHYFEIPGTVRLNLAPQARVQPFVAAGMSFGYRLRCNLTAVEAGKTVESDCDDFLTLNSDEVAVGDIGAVLGTGVEFRGRRANFTVGARLTRGLSGVFNDGDNHNQVLGLYVSVARSRNYDLPGGTRAPR